MYWDILKVEYVPSRTLRVFFADGLTGTIFIDYSFCTGVFEFLKNDDCIKLAQAKNGAVTWFDELDLAPDTMHKEIKASFNNHYVVARP